MELYTHPYIFRILKVLQLLFAFSCLALEITQLVATSRYEKLFETSYTYYTYNKLGMKIFFYVVILITIWVVGLYLIRFNYFWRNPSIYRDVGIDCFLAILWIASGLANISPIYSDTYLCPAVMSSSRPQDHMYERRLVCKTYVVSLSIGWANAALFIISTIFSWRLTKELEWRGTRTHRQSSISRRNSNRTSSLL